jgi:triacylglycerol lipase
MGGTRDERALARAWAGELAASVGQGVLAPLSLLRSGHRTRHAKDIRTVLFIHGLGGTAAGMLPLRWWLRAVGIRRQLPYDYATLGSRRRTGTLEAMAIALRRHVDATVKGGRIDVVAHSMGGLVARTWVQLLGGHRRVDRFVTLATPHRGSELAAWLPTAVGAQLRPDAELLRRLDASEMPDSVQVTSIAAARDTIVRPSSAAAAPWGHHVEIPDIGHTSMLLSPRVFAAVHDALCAPGPARSRHDDQ